MQLQRILTVAKAIVLEFPLAVMSLLRLTTQPHSKKKVVNKEIG